jgi:GNAT superfamily N-acetyltransferase
MLALGVTPDRRGTGLGQALLAAHLGVVDRRGERHQEMLVTAAERDPLDPRPRADRARSSRSLLERVGFEVTRAPGAVGRADPAAQLARRKLPG